ncbi:hypothetical protein [Devosia sediminis]|uniref:Uncharacterized protein n=1 Tax=Devosia sediminis TaxID=2798801 RepID=A0A934ML75_9HYPH|nr:hypothetical protein [Devosia sediminis]MBJ3785928.1 hypothetical protein [Devosia sediminis]
MRIQSQISALAFAAAVLAAPPAFAQLSLGINLGGNADGGGLGLDAGVDLGIGDTEVNVDAGVGVGGDSLVDADVGVDAGSSGGSTTQVDVGAEVLGDDDVVDVDVGIGSSGSSSSGGSTGGGSSAGSTGGRLIDADVTIGGGTGGSGGSGGTGGNTGGGSAGSSEPLVGVRVSALDDAARVDALIGQLGAPGIAGTDLDDIVDDTRVSIVAVADLLNQDEVEDIRAQVELGGAGRDELLAAIDASVELGAILDRAGVDSEDVIALSVDAGGNTELLVLDLGVDVADLGSGTGEDGPLLDTDLAALDIDLLTDEELAEVDLALLPNEDQRLDAIVRILGRDGGDAAAGGDFELIAVDALLGEDSLAELDAILGGDDSEDVIITADLLGVLDGVGLSPEAVIGLDTPQNGPTRVFVDAGLGEGPLGDLASVDLTLGTGSIGGGGDDGGDDDGNGGGDGGNGGGDDGTGGDDDDGVNGGGDDGTGGDNGGDDGGAGNGNGGNNNGGNGTGGNAGNGGNGGTGTIGNGGAGSGSGSGAAAGVTGNRMPAVLQQPDIVVAEVTCEAGLLALSAANVPSPADLRAIDDLELVNIAGCVQTLRQDELAALRSAIEASDDLRNQVESAGLALDDLVGGGLDQGTLTLYFDADGTTAV